MTASRPVRLRVVASRLGFFGLPCFEGESWRARYVGALGEVVLVAWPDGVLTVHVQRVHRWRDEFADPATVVLGPEVLVDAVPMILEAAMGEVRACRPSE